MIRTSLTQSMRIVKILALKSIGPNLDQVVGFLTCFPCTEKLLIEVKLLSDTSILHHAFMSIFIALWAVISRYVTILMAILSYFTRFT